MQWPRILLGIDGSAQSHYAAELCGRLSKRGCSITAQHVVDATGIWSFLAHDLPGLIGSGPYLMARESILQQLRSLAEILLDSYERYTLSSGTETQAVLSEGNPIAEICREAKKHTLVVVGHRHSGIMSAADDRRRFPRYSIAEKLSHYCPRPLLVVQSNIEDWNSITLVLSTEQPYNYVIDGICQLAQWLSLPLRICYVVAENINDMLVDRLSRALNGIHEKFPDLAISSQTVTVPDGCWLPRIDFESDTLVVLPTVLQDQIRETSLGLSPDSFLRYSDLPAILLWPDEYNCSADKEPSVASVQYKGG